MKTRQFLFWGMFLCFVVIDQAVKAWVRVKLGNEQALPFPWPGVFEIKLTYNEGIAFGFFQGKGVLLAPIAILITGGSIWYTTKHPEESKWNFAAFGLLAAGAIGNLIDRVAFRQVTDMFWPRFIRFPVFNVADSCITAATIMLIIGWWMEATRRKSHEDETEPAPVQ